MSASVCDGTECNESRPNTSFIRCFVVQIKKHRVEKYGLITRERISAAVVATHRINSSSKTAAAYETGPWSAAVIGMCAAVASGGMARSTIDLVFGRRPTPAHPSALVLAAGARRTKGAPPAEAKLQADPRYRSEAAGVCRPSPLPTDSHI